MMSRIGLAIAATAVIFLTQPATAADFPNFVGEWKAQSTPVHVGNTGHAVPKREGANFSDEMDFIFKIVEQKGNDFFGSMSSKSKTEEIIGSVRENKSEGVMVDEDGHYEFAIVDADTVDVCYWQISEKVRATNCYLLKRVK